MRQQLHNVNIFNAIEQLRREGIRHLYRGLLPPLIQATTNKSIMFASYAKSFLYFQIFSTGLEHLQLINDCSGAIQMHHLLPLKEHFLRF